MTEIGKNAFGNCLSLKKVDIPESVQVIGENAFAISGFASSKKLEEARDLKITVHYKGLFKPKGFEKGWNGSAKVVRGK